MRFPLPTALVAAGLAVAGCANQAELAQAQAEADAFSCLEQGFELDSESFALCRLILQTNRRLDQLSSRIAFLEQDINRLDLLGSPFGRVCRRC